jgi:DUF3047 family protein
MIADVRSRRTGRTGRAGALVALALLAAGAHATEVRLPPPSPATWRALTFPKVRRGTRWQAIDAGDGPGVRATSECGASALYRPTLDVDLGATPRLAWRWRIVEGLAAHDERTRAGDDFAARVYVTFAFEPGRASALERLRRRLVGAFYDEPLPGNALTYVWSSHEPAGTRWPSPYTDASRMISLGAWSPSGWRTVEVDVAADYRVAFGHAPPRLLAVAIMTDTDDTCARAVAEYADVRFRGP